MHVCAQRSVVIHQLLGASHWNRSEALWLSIIDRNTSQLVVLPVFFCICKSLTVQTPLWASSSRPPLKPKVHTLCALPLPSHSPPSPPSMPHFGPFASLFKCLCRCFPPVSPLFPFAYLSSSAQHLSLCRLSQAWARVKQLSTNRTNEVRPCIPLTGISGATLWSLSAFND